MVFKNIGVGKIDGIRIGNGGNLTVTNAVNISLNDKTIENNSMIVPLVGGRGMLAVLKSLGVVWVGPQRWEPEGSMARDFQ